MISEYKGYSIEQVTRRDWIVRDKDGKMVCNNKFPYYARTKKEAKEMVDKDIARCEFIETVVPELSFEVSESGLGLDEIIVAVENKYKGWKFSRTEARYDTCVMAVFERR